MANAPQPHRRPVSSLKLDDRHQLRLELTKKAPAPLVVAAMRYFDDNMIVEPGMIPELTTFIDAARRADPSFFVSPDALYYILEERDRRRRADILGGISNSEIENLLRVPLYPYQLDGIRAAFLAGRCVVADGLAVGNAAIALGTARLLCSRGMASSVLIICPTSLKYQWAADIERLTGEHPLVIEGEHDCRRDLYGEQRLYKIVSYHTLANDVRAVDIQPVDCVIFDEIQRISGWNSQIARSLRYVEAEHCVALSANDTDPLPEKIFDECMRLSRSRETIAAQLPDLIDRQLLIPMTREQQEIHTQGISRTRTILGTWRAYRFLSEKKRRQLIDVLSRIQAVADSTRMLDRDSRHDTKPGEVVDIVRANRACRTVVFSRWGRMTGVIASELQRFGIPCEYICGGMGAERRQAAIRDFATRAGGCVLLCTDAGLRAAAGDRELRLNDTAVDLIIHLDLPASPRAVLQRVNAFCRGKLQVVTMVSAGSIEETLFRALRAGTPVPEVADRVTLDDDDLDRLAELLSN